ncbi:MAG TPA: GNAT family N-acetyltransferase [Candidatus Eisenbacteria bacterium]|nr:GNAT family N-acetyltransferase [Candidatus Eisenbacteria bacterium]
MSDVQVRTIEERDLPEADRIFRLAFGTFLRLPDPLAFGGDSSFVRARFLANPGAGFVATRGGELVGSNFAVRWGSFGFFGPLSVRPDLWNGGVGRRLLDPVMALFERWGIRHAGLFTFAESAKHVGLYGSYGFYPRFLTAIMSKAITAPPAATARWSRFSQGAPAAALARCREITNALYDGLDLTDEIRAVATHGFGDTVLVEDGGRLAAFAVCHVGAGTEAGSDQCFVKFGAVRPGPDASADFERLLDACEAFAAGCGAGTVMGGTNLAREAAYRRMRARGYRTVIQGVAMHRPNEPAYSRPDVFAIDDWR